MNRPILSAILILILSSLACGTYLPTVTPTAPAVSDSVPAASPTAPAPTVTPSPVPTEAESETAVIQATVWVRLSDNSDSERIGSLTTGDRVEIVKCSGQWCEVKAGELSGYVWRGCTDNNPDNLLCEAKP